MATLTDAATAPFRGLKWASDKLGPIATFGGMLLIPFFCISAAAVAASATAGATALTAGQVATSFWSPLFTNAATGAVGIGPGLSNMAHGGSILLQNVWNIASSGVSAVAGGAPVTEAISTAWNAPAIV